MNKNKATAVVVAATLLAGNAFATAPDFTTLTSGIDFSSLITALMALFVAMAGVGIVAKGGSFIVRRLGFR